MALKIAHRLFSSGFLQGRNVFSHKMPSPQVLSGLKGKCFTSGSTAADCPRVQALAPNFEGTAVIDNEFKNIKLADFAGKYLYLFFYPLDFTFVCPTEIIAFSDRISEFKAINAAVVGVSCDSQFSHLAWINTPRKLTSALPSMNAFDATALSPSLYEDVAVRLKVVVEVNTDVAYNDSLHRKAGGLGELKYPLLADFKKTIAKSYNVLIDADGVALRGSFIIDPQGIVRQITVNDLPVGRSVDEVLRLIKAFQFVDKHGEVCPANWSPDKPTIKPNPKGSQEYFNKVNK